MTIPLIEDRRDELLHSNFRRSQQSPNERHAPHTRRRSCSFPPSSSLENALVGRKALYALRAPSFFSGLSAFR